MMNAKLSVNKNILSIEIDLSKEQGLSKTGKTIMIGSTKGNVEVTGHKLPHSIYRGLNCYRYPEKEKEQKGE